MSSLETSIFQCPPKYATVLPSKNIYTPPPNLTLMPDWLHFVTSLSNFYQCFCCSVVVTKAIHGDIVSHSFSFPFANVPVQPHTSFPGLSISLFSFCHTSLWVCLELGTQWKTLFQKQGAEKKNKKNCLTYQ